MKGKKHIVGRGRQFSLETTCSYIVNYHQLWLTNPRGIMQKPFLPRKYPYLPSFLQSKCLQIKACRVNLIHCLIFFFFKFYWNISTTIHLHIMYGYFHIFTIWYLLKEFTTVLACYVLQYISPATQIAFLHFFIHIEHLVRNMHFTRLH